MGQFCMLDDNLDEPRVKMRMMAIWEVQEVMKTEVSEREHPSGFLG
jgi:hypothetical protein